MLDNTDKLLIENLMRHVFKSEFSILRKELGLSNEVSQAYAFRKYGEHYIKKWNKQGLKSRHVPGKRTRRYTISDIDKFAVEDRLYQQKIKDHNKKKKPETIGKL